MFHIVESTLYAHDMCMYTFLKVCLGQLKTVTVWPIKVFEPDVLDGVGRANSDSVMGPYDSACGVADPFSPCDHLRRGIRPGRSQEKGVAETIDMAVKCCI